MASDRFRDTKGLTPVQLRGRIADEIRETRTSLKLSQHEFAERCEIPLRTYKRFELGRCDSIAVFIKVVMTFGRITSFELLFEGQAQKLNIRTPLAALERFKENAQKKNKISATPP